MRAAFTSVLVVGALAAAMPALGEVLRFRAKLAGVAESPPVATRGSGLAELTLDTDTKLLSWRLVYGGLGGTLIGAHFKTPPEPGGAVNAAMDIARPLASPIAGSARLNDIEIGDLRAGLWSVILLTAKHPNGEIRGDLERAP